MANSIAIMMKYIENHTRTLRYIEEWADVDKVVNRLFLCAFLILQVAFAMFILLAVL